MESRDDMDTITVAEAREFVKDHADRGVECPCCNQYVKVYRRKLHSQMAAFLASLYGAIIRNFDEAFGDTTVIGRVVDVRDVRSAGEKASTDASYLTNWGLVQKHGRGQYSITRKGVEFLNGDIVVPKYVYMLCNQRTAISEETIGIDEVWDEDFDFDELMGRHD